MENREMRAYRVDTNQREIVHGLRNAGYTVQHLHKVGQGCPDILVGAKNQLRRYNLLLEIKEGDGKLTSQQIVWHADWLGQVAVVRNLKEALEVVKNAIK
jgi:hypothetical protein